MLLTIFYIKNNKLFVYVSIIIHKFQKVKIFYVQNTKNPPIN